MSIQYDKYLEQHKNNVKKGLEWMLENILEYMPADEEFMLALISAHDASKSERREYNAYDAYFYGENRSQEVVTNFQKAWLSHIHRNPHHWQHWILINDDPDEGEIIMDMPYTYILEMICDWWAFSWSKGDLTEIFKWYDEHKAYMKLSENTRIITEHILGEIREKLEEKTT